MTDRSSVVIIVVVYLCALGITILYNVVRESMSPTLKTPRANIDHQSCNEKEARTARLRSSVCGGNKVQT